VALALILLLVASLAQNLQFALGRREVDR